MTLGRRGFISFHFKFNSYFVNVIACMHVHGVFI